MDKATIDAMLARGLTPREIHQAAQTAHLDKIDREIAAGKWKCPVCGARMMRLRVTSSVLVCSKGDH